jgi:superfamily II DNA or RNA helicase
MILEINNVYTYFRKEHIAEANAFTYMQAYCTVKTGSGGFSRFNKKAYFTQAGRLLTGLVPQVVNKMLAKYPDTKIEVQDMRNNLPEKPYLEFTLNDGTLYDYQQDIVKTVTSNKMLGLYWPRGVVEAATNAGKTYIMASIFMSYYKPTIILLNNQDILRQTVDFMKHQVGEDEVGEVTAGKIELKRLTICMQKTLLNRAIKHPEIKAYLNTIEVLMYDECDAAMGKQALSLIKGIQAGVRYFFSGTPLDSASIVKKMNTIGYSGLKLCELTNRDMYNMGLSLEPKIIMYLSGTYIKTPKRDNSFNDVESLHIVNDTTRHWLIDTYMKEHGEGRQVLVNANLIEHAEQMFLAMKEAGYNVRLLTGSSRNRTELIEAFKAQEFQMLVTTILERGMNIPIDTLINAQAGKSSAAMKQYRGRLVRRIGNFDDTHVVDFFDNHTPLNNHSKIRLNHYKKEGLEIEYRYKANNIGEPLMLNELFD